MRVEGDGVQIFVTLFPVKRQIGTFLPALSKPLKAQYRSGVSQRARCDFLNLEFVVKRELDATGC